MIELTSVVKKFDDFSAADSISLKIENGSAFGLLGSNGAGKSTVLRLLSGIYQPESGYVKIDGKDVFDNAEIKRKLFFVSDETVQYNNFSLLELKNFYKGFYPSFSEEIFDKLNSAVKLPEKKKMHSFSKGMKRQAIVITALSCCTEYLFLDEAFDGLDPTMRNIVKRMLVDAMLDRKITVVISSHNLKEISEICDSAALLHKGELLFSRDLDSLNGSIHKICAAFPNEYSKEDFPELEILHFEKQQSLTYIVAKGDKQFISDVLLKRSPTVLDIIPLTLEEIFIYEMEVMGYDFKI